MMKWSMMMTGKTKCELLKEIRRKICKLNGLENSEKDCPYADECLTGTCPACDAQLERINLQLEAKRLRGEAIRYDGLQECFEKCLER